MANLLTRPVPEPKLEHFYALVRTPRQIGRAGGGARHFARRCGEVPPKRDLFAGRSLEIPVPSRTGVMGWVCAGALALAPCVIVAR